jgi:hypothetical protein
MGVSAVGQGIQMSTVRHAAATLLVFVTVFFYFYGPPVTRLMSRAAERECVHLTGANYRTYRLEWHSTTFTRLSPPHWECYDTRTGRKKAIDLGWWVSL